MGFDCNYKEKCGSPGRSIQSLIHSANYITNKGKNATQFFGHVVQACLPEPGSKLHHWLLL